MGLTDHRASLIIQRGVEEDVRQIVEAIQTAFRGVPRGEITLHEAEAIDDYAATAERSKARRVDTESSWEDIPDRHIEECTNALPHLDAQSWCYYLPRYMTWVLERLTTARSTTVDHVIYTLLLGDDRSLNDYSRQRYNKLTPEQSKAVCAFLVYASKARRCDAQAASAALSKFWGKFVK